MYFTDTHVQIMSKALLEPNEQLVARTVIVDAPWYTFGMWLFHKTYLVLATTQRLIMVEHAPDFFNRGMKTEKVHSIPWAQVSEMKVKGLFLKKKLRFVAQSNMRFFKGKMKIPNAFFGLLAPVQDNLQNAKLLEQHFQSARQLGAPQQGYGSLAPGQPGSGYPAAPQLQQPQVQQQMQQQQQQWPQQYPPQGQAGPGSYYPQN